MSNRKILSHSVKPFNRYGVQINESLWVDGIPYFTSKAISEWLEMKSGPEGVDRIVQRNPYIVEHTNMIDVIIQENYKINNEKDWHVNLTCQSIENSCEKGNTTSRIRVTKMRMYSPIGLQLIAMESNTPKAKEYKVLVATLVWKLMQNNIKELNSEQSQAEQTLIDWSKVKSGRGRSLDQAKKYMKLTGCSETSAYRHWKMFREGKNPFDKKWRNNVNTIRKSGLEIKIRQLFFENPKRSVRSIWREIGSPKSPSYCVLKRFIIKLKKEQQCGE